MKFRKLQIRNIASVRDAEIDFTVTPIADTTLFLISGPTGAGKSTILDAICLALFGDVPRLHEISNQRRTDRANADSVQINDPLNLVRNDCNEAWVELEFEANNGRIYRARWQAEFYIKGAKKGLLKGVSRSLQDVEGEFITDFSKSDKNLLSSDDYLGVDFNRFTRTTLLAQGEFDRFLAGTPGDKCDILQRLVGLDEFKALGARITERRKAAEIEVSAIRSRMDGITLLTDDEISAKKADLQTYIEQSANLSKEIAVVNGVITWFTQLSQLQTQLAAAIESQTIAKAALETDKAVSTAKIIDSWTKLQPLRDVDKIIADNRRTAKDNAADFETIACRRTDFRTTFSALETKKTTVAKQLTDAEVSLKKLEPFARLIEESRIVLERLRQYENASQSLSELVQREPIFVAPDQYPVVDFDINSLVGTEGKQSPSELIGNALSVSSRKSAIINLEKARENVTRCQKIVNDLETQIANAESVELNNAETEVKFATGKVKEAGERYERVALSTKNSVRTLRSGLAIGENCPVCGTVVTKIESDEFFDELLAPLKAEKESADALFRVAVSKQAVVKAQIASLKADKLKKTAELSEARNVLAVEAKALPDLEDVEDLQTLIVGCDHSLSAMTVDVWQLAQFVNAIDYEAEIKKANDLVTEFKNATDNKAAADSELNAIHEAQSTLKNVLNKTGSVDFGETPGTPLEAVEIQSQAGALLQLFDSANATKAKLSAEFTQLEKQRREVLDTLIDVPVENLSDPTLGYTKAQIDELSKELGELRDAFIIANGAVGHANRVLAEHIKLRPDTDLTIDAAAEKLRLLAENKTVIDGQTGALERDLKADKQNRIKYADIQRELDEKQAVLDNWKTLDNLFGGDRFRNVVCSVALSRLLENANYYLTMFHDRYTMFVSPGGLEIQVRDRELNRNRVFSTLSGGESFMVSLSLALGLASLNNIRFTADTLFIDEGFGTLSSDCLESVMESLDRLRSIENRRIGIISHVESLRERIPVRIAVNPHGSFSTVSVES